jgi:hypothetical protein
VVVRQFAGREPPPLADAGAQGEDESLYYQKGAFVLHMLAGEIGEARVVAAMRRFAERRRGRAGTIDDFVDAAGGRSMRWFFDQWLGRATGPRLALLPPVVDSRGDSVIVHGAIEQRGAPYRLRIPLAAYGPHDTTTRMLRVDGSHTAFTLRLTWRPTLLGLDPAASVFKWFTADELPLEFAVVSKTVTEQRCLHASLPADSNTSRRLRDFLSRRFPGVSTTDTACPVRLLAGNDARAFRGSVAPSVPDPEPGTVSAFVARDPQDGRAVVGIEGDAEPWPDLTIPEAPLTFLRVRNGQIIGARGAGLPPIAVRLPDR